jgi:hypothetical protein
MIAKHHTWAVLLGALFALSHVLAGCNTLEKIDRQTDEILDKADNPVGSASSRGESAKADNGFSIVRRPGMTARTVKDAQRRSVAIWGQARSSSTTPGHDTTIMAKARAMALSGQYEYITVQRSWTTATGRVSESRRIPDIIRVRRDGRVDAYEVKSSTDNQDDLEQRLEEGMQSLPARHRGQVEILLPTP